MAKLDCCPSSDNDADATVPYETASEEASPGQPPAKQGWTGRLACAAAAVTLCCGAAAVGGAWKLRAVQRSKSALLRLLTESDDGDELSSSTTAFSAEISTTLVDIIDFPSSSEIPSTPITGLDAFRPPSKGVGCDNWGDILLLNRSDPTAEDCADACLSTPGCEGFGYQGDQPCDGEGSLPGACVLWMGECQQGANSCYDNYARDLSSPAGCPGKKPGDGYVVVSVHVRSRGYAGVLVRYLDELVRLCVTDEVHLWSLGSDPQDAKWLRNVADVRPAFKLLKPEASTSGNPAPDSQQASTSGNPAYAYYARCDGAASGFVPRWRGATSDRTVVVKMDGDTVYLDVASFSAFTQYVLANQDKFLVHANIVGNEVAAYYQAQHIARLGQEHPELLEYPVDGDGTPGRGGALSDPQLTLELHRDFMAHMTDYSWEEFLAAEGPCDCIDYRPPGAEQQGHFSTSFFGATWAHINKVDQLVSEGDASQEESALSQRASEQALAECIFSPLAVARLGAEPPEELVQVYQDLLANAGSGMTPREVQM